MNTNEFTSREKAMILKAAADMTGEQKTEFYTLLKDHFDSIASERCILGALTGLVFGIVWDFIPGTEFTTGIEDDTVRWIAIAAGGFLGYKSDRERKIIELRNQIISKGGTNNE
jgi:hypothetical protein